MAEELQDDPDLALSIPLKAVYEEYCCPICFDSVRDCYMTPCGHNFCQGCVRECLNRKHSCPCCNHETTADQLIKNHHVDRLVTILIAEKQAASKQYFEKLIKDGESHFKSVGGAKGQEGQGGKGKEGGAVAPSHTLSPIEQLFHKYMRKSLSSYEEYYQDLAKKHEVMCEAVKKKHTEKMMELQMEGGKGGANDRNIALLAAECELQLKEMEESFGETVGLLLAAYDTYMQDMVPAPSFLPVSVVVKVPSKDMIFKKIILKPTDNSKDLKVMLEQKFAEKGNPVVSFTQENIFVISRMIDGHLEQTAVIDEFRPLSQYKLDPGTELVLRGELKLKSDMPKSCFSAIYDKEKDMVMDYYTCKDCKFNWVCKVCAESCHKGHNIAEYILGHHPTWACCYCVKNKKCQITNIKNMKH